MLYTYFVQVGETGPIKIGVTNNPRKRFASLQVGHPDTLRLLGAVQKNVLIENKLHFILEDSRIRGEWFHPTREVVKAIMEVLLEPGAQLFDVSTLTVKPLKLGQNHDATPLGVFVERLLMSEDEKVDSTKKCIAEAVKEAKGKLNVAAQLLGISRRTLQNRMREAGLPYGQSGRRRVAFSDEE